MWRYKTPRKSGTGSNSRRLRVGCLSPICPLVLALAGCTQYPSGGNIRLHNDMGAQPVYRPQRDPLPLAEHAVARNAGERLVAPVPGARLFAIYCAPCHGPRGKGDGPVAPKLTTVANLTAEKYLGREDRFFYEAIRAGSGLMPPQPENLSAAERWDVVNYLRKLQRP